MGVACASLVSEEIGGEGTDTADKLKIGSSSREKAGEAAFPGRAEKRGGTHLAAT